MAEYKQGFFKPTNPKKYRGDASNIVYRSGWEREVMRWCDTTESVIGWNSEEIIIPYISPIDNRTHRYFVDFYVEAKGTDGNIKVMLIEVKPAAQTKQPNTQKRQTKKYLTEVMTWGVNQAKWDAATKYCKSKGWEFVILTEKEIFGKNKKNG